MWKLIIDAWNGNDGFTQTMVDWFQHVSTPWHIQPTFSGCAVVQQGPAEGKQQCRGRTSAAGMFGMIKVGFRRVDTRG